MLVILPYHHESVEVYRHILNDEEVRFYFDPLLEHHPESGQHSARVLMGCIDLGYSLGYGDDDVLMMGQSGLLHDIGKVGVAVEILDKDSALDEYEMQDVRRHSRIAFNSLKDFSDSRVRKVVVACHEFTDNPYPRDPRKTSDFDDRRSDDPDLTIPKHVLATVDMFDSLTHPRSYKPPLSLRTSKRIIAEEFTANSVFADMLSDGLRLAMVA